MFAICSGFRDSSPNFVQLTQQVHFASPPHNYDDYHEYNDHDDIFYDDFHDYDVIYDDDFDVMKMTNTEAIIILCARYKSFETKKYVVACDDAHDDDDDDDDDDNDYDDDDEEDGAD